MSTPLGIIHSDFGRVVLVQLDQSMVRHAHRECHVILKISGPDTYFKVKEKPHLLTNSNLLFVNAWEPHSYHHDNSDMPVTLLTFYFRTDWLKNLDRRFHLCGHPKFFQQNNVLLSLEAEKIRDNVLATLIDYQIPNKLKINDLMANVFRAFTAELHLPNQLFPAGAVGELGYDARIRQVIDKLISEKENSNDFDALAKSINLSRAQFFRLFSRSTGIAPATFVNMLKMERCINDLVQLDIPIQEIAETLGYFPQGNFTRFFSGQQGISPSHYRKAIVAI